VHLWEVVPVVVVRMVGEVVQKEEGGVAGVRGKHSFNHTG
jgi:hypothetical protein